MIRVSSGPYLQATAVNVLQGLILCPPPRSDIRLSCMLRWNIFCGWLLTPRLAPCVELFFTKPMIVTIPHSTQSEHSDLWTRIYRLRDLHIFSS